MKGQKVFALSVIALAVSLAVKETEETEILGEMVGP